MGHASGGHDKRSVCTSRIMQSPVAHLARMHTLLYAKRRWSGIESRVRAYERIKYVGAVVVVVVVYVGVWPSVRLLHMLLPKLSWRARLSSAKVEIE